MVHGRQAPLAAAWRQSGVSFESRQDGYIGLAPSDWSDLVTTTVAFEHDPLQQLVAAQATGGYTATFAYAYDSAGNRLAARNGTNQSTTGMPTATCRPVAAAPTPMTRRIG